MKVEKLTLRCFRNIERMELCPTDNVNIICGDNAQGKTNLLEAIWLFTGARSFRSGRDQDFLQFGAARAELELAFTARERQQSAELKYTAATDTATAKRSVSLNGVPLDGATKLAGEFCAVVFSPDHLSLVKQGPENRRRFIDTSLCQAHPKYIRALDGYNKSLKQRNSLLRDARMNAGLLDMLDIWDKNIIDYGAYITATRDRYLRKLGAYAAETYAGMAGEREKLAIKYLPSFSDATDGFEKADYRDALQRAVEKSRAEDIRLMTSTTGPHRDDMDITIAGISARNFGSQGQQRSAILALKLAECGILEDRNGEPPVVLLDDVMSELDASRQEYLLNSVSGLQVIITCCDTAAFSRLNTTSGKSAGIMYIQSGALVEKLS